MIIDLLVNVGILFIVGIVLLIPLLLAEHWIHRRKYIPRHAVGTYKPQVKEDFTWIGDFPKKWRPPVVELRGFDMEILPEKHTREYVTIYVKLIDTEDVRRFATVLEIVKNGTDIVVEKGPKNSIVTCKWLDESHWAVWDMANGWEILTTSELIASFEEKAMVV